MRHFVFVPGVMLILFVLAPAEDAEAAQQVSYSDTEDAIERIRERSELFEHMFKDDIDDTAVDSDIRDRVERVVERFEDTAELLDNRHSKDNPATFEATELLKQAAEIDRFVSQHGVSPRVESQWGAMRPDLDRLATAYNLTRYWPTALARAEIRPPGPPVVVIVPERQGAQDLKNLTQDLHLSTDAFQTSMAMTLSSSPAVDAGTSRIVDQYINEFRVSVARLNTANITDETVGEVFRRAEPIDNFMRTHPLPASAQESWIRVRNNLIRLAAAYNLSPAWLR